MKRLKTLADLKTHYVAAVAALPQVRKVVFYPRSILFWTITDAPPFEREPHYQVYGIIQEILGSSGDSFPIPDFHVVNVQDWRGAWREEDILPTGREVLYTAPDVARAAS